jgi:hypothetical protein
MHTIITRLEHTRNIQHCFTYGFKQTAATRQRAYKYARHVDLHVRRTTHIQKQTHKLVYRMYGMADYRWNITSQTSVVYHTTAGTRNVIFLVVGVCETYAVRLKHMSTSANSVQHIPPKHACYMGSLSIYRYIYIHICIIPIHPVAILAQASARHTYRTMALSNHDGLLQCGGDLVDQ